jgi:hypothetical protein
MILFFVGSPIVFGKIVLLLFFCHIVSVSPTQAHEKGPIGASGPSVSKTTKHP